jgi:hypothetical protein
METPMKSAKKGKPLHPTLPGGYGKMTREELDRESDKYDAEFSGDEFMRMTKQQLADYYARIQRGRDRKRGRPAKPSAEKAARVLLTMEPKLLAATDKAAKKAGLTRAGFIADAIRRKLKIA